MKNATCFVTPTVAIESVSGAALAEPTLPVDAGLNGWSTSVPRDVGDALLVEAVLTHGGRLQARGETCAGAGRRS